MKNTVKIFKYFGSTVLLLGLLLIVYMYSLTFTLYGRMDWRKAVVVKLGFFNTISEEQCMLK